MEAWFIIALLLFPNGDQYTTKMNKPFVTKELCEQFYKNNPSVRQDLAIMFPDHVAHSFICVSIETEEKSNKPKFNI
jgi:hypothetical protein